MMSRSIRNVVAFSFVAAVAAATFADVRSVEAQAGGITVAELASRTHFHGISIDAADPDRILLATHHGLWRVDLSGRVDLVSQSRDDFMGFTPHPTDASVLYASGHPATGGNLGVIFSSDGGRTWTKVADGVGGPVDFHQLDVSRSSPNVMYGGFDGLQRSEDGGKTWRLVGPLPSDTFDLAVSPADPAVVYAATRHGLLRGTSGGTRWSPEFGAGQTVTMVQASADALFAYVAGIGLARRDMPGPDWRVLSPGPRDAYLIHLAVAAAQPLRLYAVAFDVRTRRNSILVSKDGGARWLPLGG